MTHFRGQIRGPHWGPTMDTMLIDFWRRHECLFNSSDDSYYDKDLKTRLWSEFASSVGKSVSEVERRSRSLRTQYGRVLWHPEKVNTAQQKMLREKLAFLRPYIVRRRGESHVFDDREEDNEEPETEGSIDQEMGSSFGSPLDVDVTEADLDDSSSSQNPPPLPCLNPQPLVTDVMSLSIPHLHREDGPADQPVHAANSAPRRDILNQFAEVMLADMRHIRDPVVLMRLRRDITDLVFKAVEEDEQRRCVRVPPAPGSGGGAQLQSCPGPRQTCSQGNFSWRERFLKRRSKGCEGGRRAQRWGETRHARRAARCQSMEAAQLGQAAEGMSENSSQGQGAEIKRETEPHVVKIEEETLALV